MRRRRSRECALAQLQPCERAFARRIPALMRRAGGGRGIASSEVVDPNLYGLTNFTDASYMASASGVGGGELGNLTGFGAGIVFRLDAPLVAGTTRYLFGRYTASPTSGYLLYIDTNNKCVWYASTTSGVGAGMTGTYTFGVADVGKVFHLCGVHTGASNTLQIYLNGVAMGVPVACVGYKPTVNVATMLGRGVAAGVPAGPFTVLGQFTVTGLPNAAQIKAHADAARALGDVPVTMDGATVTHRWSAKDELAGTVVVNGQAAPAQLTDRTTLASADALIKNGSPTVRVIDPTIDGRRTLGAQGFSAANGYTTALNTGLIGNASGFTASCVFTSYAGVSATRFVHGVWDAGITGGWSIDLNAPGTTLRVVVYNTAGSAIVLSIALSVADLGRARLFTLVHTGSALIAYLDGIQAGTIACVGYRQLGTARFVIGAFYAIACESYCWFGSAGGNIVATAADAQALNDAWEATKRMPTMAGFTHCWDPSLDTLASGVDAVPAQVLDRVGTDHLTRLGIDVRATANGIRGVGPYGIADYWATAPGGGIQGVNTGFHVVLDLWLTKVPTAQENVVGAYSLGNNSGWAIIMTAAAKLEAAFLGVAISSLYSITAADLNKRLRIVFVKTSTAMQLWVNGTQVTPDVTATMVANAATVQMSAGIGLLTTLASPVASGYIEGIAGGHIIASPADVATYCADLTQPIPTIAGVTLKRWRFEDDIAAVSGALPVRSVERISGGDDLVRIGSPLTLAQRTERLWGYETAPIWYGVQGVTGAYYSIAGGFAGDPAGFGFVWVGSIDSQSVASATRFLCGKRDLGAGFPGCQLATIGTNSAFQFIVGSSSAIATATTSGITAAELGRTFVVVCWYDGTKAHMFVRRVEIGAGSTALTGVYAPSAQPFTVGARADATLPADGTTFRGFAALSGPPSLAEAQAIHDAILAQESIPLTLPRVVEVYDVTPDTRANGGALPNTITGRLAGQNLAKTGAPTLGTTYARAAA